MVCTKMFGIFRRDIWQRKYIYIVVDKAHCVIQWGVIHPSVCMGLNTQYGSTFRLFHWHRYLHCQVATVTVVCGCLFVKLYTLLQPTEKNKISQLASDNRSPWFSPGFHMIFPWPRYFSLIILGTCIAQAKGKYKSKTSVHVAMLFSSIDMLMKTNFDFEHYLNCTIFTFRCQKEQLVLILQR